MHHHCQALPYQHLHLQDIGLSSSKSISSRMRVQIKCNILTRKQLIFTSRMKGSSPPQRLKSCAAWKLAITLAGTCFSKSLSTPLATPTPQLAPALGAQGFTYQLSNLQDLKICKGGARLTRAATGCCAVRPQCHGTFAGHTCEFQRLVSAAVPHLLQQLLMHSCSARADSRLAGKPTSCNDGDNAKVGLRSTSKSGTVLQSCKISFDEPAPKPCET